MAGNISSCVHYAIDAVKGIKLSSELESLSALVSRLYKNNTTFIGTVHTRVENVGNSIY